MIIVISASLGDDLGAIWEAGGTIWAYISELGVVVGTGWNFMISHGAQKVRAPCKSTVDCLPVSVLVTNNLARKLEKETTTEQYNHTGRHSSHIT
jgi:hypothetical protein